MNAKRRSWVADDACYIPLTGGLVAVVDLVDADLGDLNWFSTRKGYAARSGPRCPRQKWITMHRVVAVRAGLAVVGLEIDHRDGDRLNNRRANLRPATRAQQVQNTSLRSNNRSGVKGVYWDKKSGKWRAVIKADGRAFQLGMFSDLNAAAKAYAEASKKYHGDFGRAS